MNPENSSKPEAKKPWAEDLTDVVDAYFDSLYYQTAVKTAEQGGKAAVAGIAILLWTISFLLIIVTLCIVATLWLNNAIYGIMAVSALLFATGLIILRSKKLKLAFSNKIAALFIRD